MKEAKDLKYLQANLQIMYQKLSNIHWNIKGLEFFEIHEEVDKLRGDVLNFIDEIAEKIVMKGYLALGSYDEILKMSTIKELPSKEFDFKEATTVIVEDLTFILTKVEVLDWSKRVQPIIDELMLSFDKWIWQFSKLIK
ncbi:Dps family protein [Mycoplasmopsis cynos]|uniref:Neutrophil activating factor NapA (Bacterioferritin) n=1 Tax=Mycoplasmopsis cynos (strain C142) TaxID=1246955 RepID=L0RXF0_MYCC1|nr:DNA starvation/stationary phase protection protein [Mycoplasmopsis cynos]WQQ12894.1 DNA starvation/stationary phase protection protein [Mycoplasmopsis cynos]WQQ13783.1 DNA starvation/stationary phase protection protein [Mycoplasmopsis cynos]WQQ17374.1 DNA starvation/stationary phase protection protein [Mycoplasmopsis cynos]CCP24271.1 Neutrophil activating factor NapA (Bacterioferritin) [Mycoplasmopsis cynos C142]